MSGTKTYWLIEMGSPAIYYCGPGDWCNNANHARKFRNEQAAKNIARNMRDGKIRVVQHAWYDPNGC